MIYVRYSFNFPLLRLREGFKNKTTLKKMLRFEAHTDLTNHLRELSVAHHAAVLRIQLQNICLYKHGFPKMLIMYHLPSKCNI